MRDIPSWTTEKLTKSSYLVILLMILVITAFVSGYLARDVFSPESFTFPIARQVYQIIKDRGIKPLPARQQMEYGLIRGLLAAYNDPFTTFTEPPQAELRTNQLEGKFGGIGVRIEPDGDGQYVLFPLPGSPSLDAGIQDGDILIEVDGQALTKETTLDQVQALIRGPIGEPVKMAVLRNGDNAPLRFTIQREEVPVPSVTYNLSTFDSSVGVIQISLIAETTPSEILTAVSILRGQGALRFILDLRNNGGGLVDGAVSTASLFMNQGTVLIEQFRDQKPKSFTNDQPGPLIDLPLVIVVNQNTASAAEIVAGSLNLLKGTPLIGNRTYGKDTVQSVFDLKDKSTLAVSAGRWWIPGHEETITGKGLTLTLVVSEEEANSQDVLEKAAELFNTTP